MSVKYSNDDINNSNLTEASENVIGQNDFTHRKSSRIKKIPQRYDDYVTGNLLVMSPHTK